jgi:type 1 glutamine amidotransferase
MNRRDFLHSAGLAALSLGAAGAARALDSKDDVKRRVLMFTRSEGFQHSVVTRKGDKLSLAEQIVTDLAAKNKLEVVCEKDGRVFLSKDFPKFDGFLFETQGDLGKEKSIDGQPPVPPDGKKALLDAVASGKGFVGCHCASDTWHSKGEKWQNQEGDDIDPYLRMLGGEFIRHGQQQKAWMRVADPAFPGLKDVKDFEMMEEWYSLKNFAPDLHVVLVQDTKGMKNLDYERPPFPASWARLHGKGRVFYTSMGHREDVWQSDVFQGLLLAALLWSLGDGKPDLAANMDKAAPKGRELPKPPK